MMKKWGIAFCVLLFLSFTLFVFRAPILRSFTCLLITQDTLEKADAIIILSGGSYDRGNKAAEIFKQGFAPLIICPGSNPAYEFKILNINITESEQAKMNLLRLGIPDSAIVVINKGTSTYEEAQAIGEYLKTKPYKKIILLTSLYHTKRAKQVFEKFIPHNIKLIVCGAKSSRFDEYNWWRSEDGLISMNNELIKKVYYILKGK
ncbi:MAG TPA: YdcF family protein [Chitinophagales bacterium]|nr:YdcF family protein [Chitinophagales bacterium]HRP39121.1 YdcF family protein [Chitinophagales bacterium]